MSDWVGIFITLISLFIGGFVLGVKWGEKLMSDLIDSKVTYLLPIWIDLKCRNHRSVMRKINQDLKEFFEAKSEKIAEDGCSIEIQWSINKHIPGGEI